MCLNTLNTKKQINEFKKQMPRTGLTVYKMVRIKDDQYYPIYRKLTTPYEEGVNEAQIEPIKTIGYQRTGAGSWTEMKRHGYQSGFHSWIKEEDAIRFKKNQVTEEYQHMYVIVECIVRKSWVTAVGMNEAYYDKIKQKTISRETVVTNKIIMPKFKEEKE